MTTITTGRPLDADGDPTDGPALELDPDGEAAALFAESPHALASSPGAKTWSAYLQRGDDPEDRPAILVWLAPGAMGTPAHVHSVGSERFETLRGTLTVDADGETVELGPGETYTVEPGVEHGFGNESDEFVAFRADLPWAKTAETQFTFMGLDHEGAFSGGPLGGLFGSDGGLFSSDGGLFGSGDGYGEPGPVHAAVMGEAISEGTTITAIPQVIQRAMWATVGRVARARGHRAVEERFLTDAYWRAKVEQPELAE